MMTQIYRQFENPRGALGALACFVMSHRPSNKARNRWTVDLIAPEPNARVLEIGCGPGLALAAMCDRISTGRVVGLDHSPLMLVQAAKGNTRAIEEGRLPPSPGRPRSACRAQRQFRCRLFDQRRNVLARSAGGLPRDPR